MPWFIEQDWLNRLAEENKLLRERLGMSENETMNTSSTGAKKAGNLERYDLIPAEPLRLLAKHYGVGARKYDDRNWERGYNWSLSFAALNRHLWQFWNGQDTDEETGTPHIVCAAWHAFALAEYMGTHPEFDDRPASSPTLRVDPEQIPMILGLVPSS